MATVEALDRKQRGTTVWVTRRLNGHTEVQGTLFIVLQKMRHLAPMIGVEFSDGIEYFSPDDVMLNAPPPRQQTLF